MSNRRIYITAAIPYVNGDPHIGHAYSTIAADVLTGCAKPLRSLASSPPMPIDSTAELGTSINAPFSFKPSYSMFIARRFMAPGWSR